MARRIIIDTSYFIDHLRGGYHWKDLTLSLDPEENLELFLPTIIIYELYSGQSSRKISQMKQMSKMFRLFKQIELDQEIAERAGKLYRDLTIKFQTADYIIAATALELGAEVVTLNIKHFSRVPGLKIYQLDE